MRFRCEQFPELVVWADGPAARFHNGVFVTDDVAVAVLLRRQVCVTEVPDPESRTPLAVVPAPPTAPARVGRGSSLAAWRTYAATVGAHVTDDMSRDDVVKACDQARPVGRAG